MMSVGSCHPSKLPALLHNKEGVNIRVCVFFSQPVICMDISYNWNGGYEQMNTLCLLFTLITPSPHSPHTQEMTEVEEQEEDESGGAEALVEALLEGQVVTILVHNLQRMDETHKAEADGVHNSLGGWWCWCW